MLIEAKFKHIFAFIFCLCLCAHKNVMNDVRRITCTISVQYPIIHHLSITRHADSFLKIQLFQEHCCNIYLAVVISIKKFPRVFSHIFHQVSLIACSIIEAHTSSQLNVLHMFEELQFFVLEANSNSSSLMMKDDG